MATGGIFQLITNDGKQDRMLMATALLNKRLRLIEQVRHDDPLVDDSTPTLLDIEKTHILFMNAHFKPFAAIGYEYNKQRPQSGVTTLGSTVTFSIPQFGDFFHDMILHIKLKAPVINRADDVFLDDPNDQNDAQAGRQHAPAFRWCEYPGERLMQKVEFQVNGNPLDEYTYQSYNFWREFCVSKEKEAGYNRCMGQETAMPGFWRQPGIDYSFGANPGSASGVPWSGVGPTNCRVEGNVHDGPQTPKLNASDLELFVPLLFWFNLDPRLAIPSVAIPYGQRFINITLAPANCLYGLVPRGSGTWDNPRGTLTPDTNEVTEIELYINNIFVNPEVHDIFIRRIGFSLIRVHRQQIYNADKSSFEILLNNLKWPIETLFVGMRLQSYTTCNNYNLHRWHKFSGWDIVDCSVGNTLSLEGGNAVLSNTGLVAASDRAWNVNDTVGDPSYLQISLQSGLFGNDWATTGLNVGDMVQIGGCVFRLLSYNNTGADPENACFTPFVEGLTDVPNTPIVAGTLLDGANFCTLKESIVEYPQCVRTVDTLEVKAHGISLYNTFPATFFDSYIPYQYGGNNIRTPDFCGPMMITFNLYPRSYQPSGHVNVSRAREFYLNYTSSVISSSVLGELVVVASALNFLLISDGSAVLRYST